MTDTKTEIVPTEERPIPQSTMMAVEQSRAIQEVQAAFVIAKNYPRDEVTAENRIVQACKRVSLAEQAEYAYPRGGQQITGPSIRLAETLARYWGNLNYGIRELSNNSSVSEMEAYCHDLETNTKASRVFRVPNERHSRRGVTKLSDPRDVYENNANQGARRLRACILEVIPGDVVEIAIEQCHKTLSGQSDTPIKDRIKAMVAAFEGLGVSKAQIEERFQKNVQALLEVDLVKLRQIFSSIKDGMSKAEDWFQVSQVEKLKERISEMFDPEHGKVPEDNPTQLEELLEEAETPQDIPWDKTDICYPKPTVGRPSNWVNTLTDLSVDIKSEQWCEAVMATLQEFDIPCVDDVPAEARKDFVDALKERL